MSPTIFNVVIDSVIRYWVAVVAPTKDGTEGLGLLIQDLVVYFYVNNGIIALTQLESLQRAFDVLASPFERVRLCTNARKMIIIAFHP